MSTPEEVLRAIELGQLEDRQYPSARATFEALNAHGWHAGRAARALRIGRVTLWRRLVAWGISLREEKKKHWPEFWWGEIMSRRRRKKIAGKGRLKQS